MSMHGAGCDNLLSATIVLPDGRQVKTSDDSNPDHFRAIRGGGGNVGVATGFEYRLHQVDKVLAGALTYPPEQFWNDGSSQSHIGYSCKWEDFNTSVKKLAKNLGYKLYINKEFAAYIVISITCVWHPIWQGELLSERTRFHLFAFFLP